MCDIAIVEEVLPQLVPMAAEVSPECCCSSCYSLASCGFETQQAPKSHFNPDSYETKIILAARHQSQHVRDNGKIVPNRPVKAGHDLRKSILRAGTLREVRQEGPNELWIVPNCIFGNNSVFFFFLSQDLPGILFGVQFQKLTNDIGIIAEIRVAVLESQCCS